ncbi:hypothetical protein [Mesorhizobium sp. WSM2240]|uniref:DUF2946 domain-containing protein n=1 Tax=Mesorhizobium sp. WSM2240 TaxID=3228851 RepID=A0AAU8CQB1_9HYPH
MLFTVAATLVLLAHLFQPLAEAYAANTAKAWVICTMFGEAKSPAADGALPPPGAADDCPTCIGGPCAGMDAPPKLSAGSKPAFAAPAAYAGQFPQWLETENPPARLNEPPPAIRAPPLSA